MDFDLTPEQYQIRQTFSRYCDERIAPQAASIDEAHAFPRAIFDELGELGFFALRYPEQDGGHGLDLLTLCLALEEIARGSMSVAACATMQSLMGTTFLHRLGNAELTERLFKPALTGAKVGGICITEPNAGSDLGAIATVATKVDGGYRLNGQKMWVTSAPVADFFTVFARAGADRKLTIFLVEKDFPGLHIGRAIPKMGVWALPTSEISLDDCFVPMSHRLSREEGDGEAHLRAILAEIRIVTAALAIGGARGALDEAIRYAGERRQFGKPINRHQAVQHRLADMATGLEAARRLTHYAAWLKDTDRPHQKEAAMAKLFASETASRICEQAMQVFASYGFSMEHAVQRHFRDIRFTLIGGGTSDVLRLVIGKELEP